MFLEVLKNGSNSSYIFSNHYYLGIIYSKEGASAKALREFEWCLEHAEEGQIPRQHIDAWLTTISRDLGLEAEAQRYEKLSKQ